MAINTEKLRKGVQILGLKGKGGFQFIPTPFNNEIWYTTNDNQPLAFEMEGFIPITNKWNKSLGMFVATFESDVTEIPAGAFASMGEDLTPIQSISLPNTVTTIGSYAFAGTSLESIFISQEVISLGVALFTMSPLSKIKISKSNEVYDSRNNCNAIIETATNTLLCGCANSTIPNGVEKIGDNAFGYVSFNSNITLPNTVKEIDGFNSTSGLTNLVFPSSVEKIKSNAFIGSEDLQTIEFEEGDSLEIESLGFQMCEKLHTVTCHYTTPPTIGETVFSGCTALQHIYVPAESVDAYKAADGWSDYADVIFAEYPPQNKIYYTSTDGNVITPNVGGMRVTVVSNTYTDGIGVIEFSGNLTNIGNYFMQNNSTLESVILPNDGITSIGGDAYNGAFKYCRSLTSINIPSSVTSIGERVFFDCRSLTSINIPSSVTSIGKFVFSGCAGLTSVNIPSSVTSISSNTFNGCTSLTSIDIPSSVTSIGPSVFVGCSSLTSIDIPSSVTSIGASVFKNCTGLTSCKVLATTPPTIGTDVFVNTSASLKIYVPAESVDTYKSADGWSENADIIEAIPE